jgi:hypothetical protein
VLMHGRHGREATTGKGGWRRCTRSRVAQIRTKKSGQPRRNLEEVFDFLRNKEGAFNPGREQSKG